MEWGEKIYCYSKPLQLPGRQFYALPSLFVASLDQNKNELCTFRQRLVAVSHKKSTPWVILFKSLVPFKRLIEISQNSSYMNSWQSEL